MLRSRKEGKQLNNRKEQSTLLRIDPSSIKMAAENLNKSKLKTNTSTRKSTLTLVILPSFRISGEISVEKM